MKTKDSKPHNTTAMRVRLLRSRHCREKTAQRHGLSPASRMIDDGFVGFYRRAKCNAWRGAKVWRTGGSIEVQREADVAAYSFPARNFSGRFSRRDRSKTDTRERGNPSFQTLFDDSAGDLPLRNVTSKVYSVGYGLLA
jgi:hypothetical protein